MQAIHRAIDDCRRQFPPALKQRLPVLKHHVRRDIVLAQEALAANRVGLGKTDDIQLPRIRGRESAVCQTATARPNNDRVDRRQQGER